MEASTLHVRRAYVELHHGSAAVSDLLRHASSPLQRVLASSSSGEQWVPFELFVELNVLIDRLHGAGDFALVREVGRYAAAHNAGSWRALFEKGVDIATFMGIVSGLWRKHYDSGSVDSVPEGERAVRLTIKNGVQAGRDCEGRGAPLPRKRGRDLRDARVVGRGLSRPPQLMSFVMSPASGRGGGMHPVIWPHP